MHIVLLDDAARDDLVNAMATYDSLKDGLGFDFAERVKDILSHIAENPSLYPVFHRQFRKAVMDRFPYLVIYHLVHDEVRVMAIWHGKRSPRKLLQRLNKPSA